MGSSFVLYVHNTLLTHPLDVSLYKGETHVYSWYNYLQRENQIKFSLPIVLVA